MVMVIIEEESDELEIPFTEIRGVVLAKVVEFMRHYHEEPFPKIAKVGRSFL